MNLTRSASQVSTTSELLQRNSGARWAAPKDDDPPSPPAKPPPLTKGKSTKIKRRGTSLALASGERVHMQAQAWGRGRHGQLGSIDEQSDGLRAQAAGLPQPIFTDVHVHAAACGACAGAESASATTSRTDVHSTSFTETRARQQLRAASNDEAASLAGR